MLDDHLDALRHGLERMRNSSPDEDHAPWVVIAVVPMSGTGRVATPLLGGCVRFTMRRFHTAEEAMVHSITMPAARSFGGWAIHITTGETVRINPFTSDQVP